MTKNQKHGYALKSGEGIHIDFRGTKMDVKVSGAQSEGAYSLIEPKGTMRTRWNFLHFPLNT